MTRSLLLVVSLGLLAGCGGGTTSGERAEGGETVSSASLDKDELSEELVTALISENLPPPRCVWFTAQQFYSYEPEGGGDPVRWRTGTDELPRNFVFGSSVRGEWDFDGLEPLINAGLLTATRVREYTKAVPGPFQSTNKHTYHVYRIDFSNEVKHSETFTPNMGNSLTDASNVILGYCIGNYVVSNVQYSLPNGGSGSTATFTWNAGGGEDPLADRIRSISNNHALGIPTLPATSGTGSASFQLTNNGWVTGNVQFDQ